MLGLGYTFSLFFRIIGKDGKEGFPHPLTSKCCGSTHKKEERRPFSGSIACCSRVEAS